MDNFAFIIHPIDPKRDVQRKFPALGKALPASAIATVYESPVVTGTSTRRLIVIPASPTTDVYAPNPTSRAPLLRARRTVFTILA